MARRRPYRSVGRLEPGTTAGRGCARVGEQRLGKPLLLVGRENPLAADGIDGHEQHSHRGDPGSEAKKQRKHEDQLRASIKAESQSAVEQTHQRQREPVGRGGRQHGALQTQPRQKQQVQADVQQQPDQQGGAGEAGMSAHRR